MRIFSVLAAACLVCCMVADMARAADHSVTLVYASHLANIQRRTDGGGLPELAGLLNELRGKMQPVLFVHAGNALGPSPLSSFDKGAHMIGLLNLLEPTVMAVGRRDFMHKEDELVLRAGEATFPLVCSNIVDPLTGKQPDGLAHTYLAEAGEFVVGVIALVSPELETSYIQDRVNVSGGYELLAELNTSLRQEGADFVLATADFLPSANENPGDILNASGVDMLMLSEARGETVVHVAGDKAWGLQGRERDVFVAELTAQTNQKSLRVNSVKVVVLNGQQVDEDVAEAVRSYAQSLESLLAIPVGVTTTELDTTTQTIRTRENAFANLVTDAMRAYYDADAALINSGGLRGNQRYPAGTQLVRRDLQAEMPLHDTSCLTQLRGDALLAALEYSVSGVENVRGRFLQVSGLHFSYAPDAPEGARIRSVFVGGKVVDPRRVYTLSVPAYLAKQGDGYTMFSGVCMPDAPRPPQELLELVRAYISRHTPVAPKIEGRIMTEN